MREKAKKLALAIIKKFEGCKLVAFQCPAGVWTIGWGQTKGIKPGMRWTQEEADADLEKTVDEFMDEVLSVCPVLEETPPYMLAACTSLAYNIGVGAFAKSSICRHTKNGRYIDAANAFLLYIKAGGVILKGLQKRRAAEKELYEGKI